MPQHTLHFQGKAHRFRSKDLLHFLRLIHCNHPQATKLQDIKQSFPSISGKQLARYIETLEERGLALLNYQTKTRGPYQLKVAHQTLQLPPIEATAPVESPKTETSVPSFLEKLTIDDFLNPAWIEWISNLMQANLCLQSAQFSYEEGGNFRFLQQAETAALTLPSWARLVVDVCHAHHLERASRYRDASTYLKRIEKAALHQHIPPIILARARLCRTKILYDQGRYHDSQKELNGVQILSTHFPPLWRNMQGLLNGQRLNQASTISTQTRQDLDQALLSFLEGMTDIFMHNGDYSILDALSFNYANNLYRAIKKSLISTEHMKTVLHWFLLNILICREVGIGDHSIYTHLLIVDMIDEFNLSKSSLPDQLAHLLDTPARRRQYLQRYLNIARKSGNRLEIAECLMRLGQRTEHHDQAQAHFEEAMELALSLANPTLLKEIRGAILARKHSTKQSETNTQGSSSKNRSLRLQKSIKQL